MTNITNEFGYTRNNLIETIKLAIKASPEAVQFGEENIVGRVPKDHLEAVKKSQSYLCNILARLENGCNQAYVDCIAEGVWSSITTIYYIPSSWGYTSSDMV